MHAFIFDMDGTLLHTLPDLTVAVNEALAVMGFPARSYDEIESLMGSGSQRMIDLAAPPDATSSQRECLFELWRSIYLESGYTLTVPYPGIVQVLERLRARGATTAILSNKFDAGVHMLADRLLPGLFDAVRGEIPPTPRKPDPTSLLRMLKGLGVEPREAAYIGDTNVDMELARNAGVAAVGVAWGYDAAAPLPQNELDIYLRDPAELLSLLTESATVDLFDSLS